MPSTFVLLLILVLPLAAFALLGLWGKRVFKNASGLLSTLSMGLVFGLSLYVAYVYFYQAGAVEGTYRTLVPWQGEWLRLTNSLVIHIGILLDPISVMMLVVVSGISLMVQLYSLEYMRGEERFSIYYSYLSLFSFSMLGLVVAPNLFQTYIFWELVGVSSFLLIGFYYDRPSAVAASKKAFIVTRFADLGFLVGILLLSFYSNSLDISEIIGRLSDPANSAKQAAISHQFLGVSALSWGLALIFVGGAGKSAMFPLHIWLPDAMEGPTPVSALIHAATMVVAGVYLVARMFPLYAASGVHVLECIAGVGAFSAAIAALIACTQTDIKRVLAYSTMSQIGYMMLSLGAARSGGGEESAGFTASMFHLFTHAMFKASLFLCAGVVIHAIHSNETKDMGGLRKNMPWTHAAFLIACLAICGIPPFSGFFSKEEILWTVHQHHPLLFMIALLTSGITAFYIFRLYYLIFWNHPAASSGQHHGRSGNAEGGWSIRLPLLLLSIGAMFSGFLPFGNWVSADGRPLPASLHPLFSLAPLTLAALGIGLASWLYLRRSDRPARIAETLGGLYRAAYRKFYIDELYLFVTKKIIFPLIGRPAAWIDRNLVDGMVNATGQTTETVSENLKGLQSGRLQGYAWVFLAGALGLALWFIYG